MQMVAISKVCISLISAEPSGDFEANNYPVCPAVEVDICVEECTTDDNCEETELCCAGCGHSCRIPTNLPYYDVPLACPPQTVFLSSDSATCDLECQSDAQCPGSKICCRSGCSSSCQNGEIPPGPCRAVREQLEVANSRDREDEDEEQVDPPLVGQYVPSCLDEGWFNPVQTWENTIWCGCGDRATHKQCLRS